MKEANTQNSKKDYFRHNKKIIIHDWDDTITNSFETYYGWYDLFADYFSLQKSDMKVVKKVWGSTVPQIVVALWKDLDLVKAEGMIQEFGKSSTFVNADFTPKPFTGVKKTLQYFNEMGYTLGILSSGRRVSIEKSYTRYLHSTMEYLHSFVVTQHDTKYHKPDPRVFNSVLDILSTTNMNIEDAMYVGDSLLDFEVSQKVGIEFYAVLTGLNTKEQFLNQGLDTNHILNSFSELPIKVVDIDFSI